MSELIFTFGERLRLARRRSKLSQDRLAKKIGVHLSTISRWERDHSTHEMSVKHLLRIAIATKTTPLELLPPLIIPEVPHA